MKLMTFCWLLLTLQITGCEQLESHDSSTKQTGEQMLHGGQPLRDYATARKEFWRTVYSGKVTSLYCRESFSSKQRRGYNVEHVFPMSWVTNGLQCGKRKQCRQRSAMFNRIEADMHNLFPARSDVNHERSSYRFGIVGGEKREFGRCDFEVDYKARAVEPSEEVRGEVARAMFYMASRYKEQGVKLFEKQARLLINWHRADPPNDEEVRRNEVIFTIQNNRNPFVDDPGLLDRLYQSGAFK